jgi:L-glutamine-phosphate cytidylyltransferase
MKAILLSAGRGTRMMPYTKDRPKPLLKIDPKNTVLDIQLKKIQDTPINEVIIVGGYLSDKIEKKAKKEYPKMDIKVIYNPFYDISNNFVSLWTARHNMDEPFIVINGDNLFQSSVINGLIKKTKGKEVVMVIDKKQKYDDDDMKVVIKKDKIKEVSKNIDINKANGESIGMIKFEGNGIKKLKETMDEMIKNQDNRNVFWLRAIQKMINKYNNVDYYEIKREQWEEIDFHEDYDKLRKGGHKRFYFERECDKKLVINKNNFILKNLRKLNKEFNKIFNYIFNK